MTICHVLGEAAITVGTQDASVFLLWHLLRKFDCFSVNFRITRFLCKFHLSGYFNSLLNWRWLLSPVCFERILLWLTRLSYLLLCTAFWSALTHCFVLKNFFRHHNMTITTLISVDRFKFAIIDITAGIYKAVVTFLGLDKLFPMWGASPSGKSLCSICITHRCLIHTLDFGVLVGQSTELFGLNRIAGERGRKFSHFFCLLNHHLCLRHWARGCSRFQGLPRSSALYFFGGWWWPGVTFSFVATNETPRDYSSYSSL